MTRDNFKSGGAMLGPIERERCSKHRTRWVLFRWVWAAGEDPEVGEIESVRGCATCNEESNDE